MDLREFIAQLTAGKDGRDWSDARFIGSKAALDLAAGAASGKSSTPEELARKKEICGLLNQIPVFTLLEPGGTVLACPDENGKPFIPWLLDGEKAKEMRDAALRQGRAGITLRCEPLGDILAILLGWKSQTSKAAMRVTSYPDAYALLMKSLEGKPKQQELESRDWLVPAFCCPELDSAAAKTCFLSHYDLLSFLAKKRGAEAKSAGDGATSGAASGADENKQGAQVDCHELCDVMLKMLSGDEEWANVRFVGPSNAREALELMRELKEDSQVNPPALDSAESPESPESPKSPESPTEAPAGSGGDAEEDPAMVGEPIEPDVHVPDNITESSSEMFRVKEVAKPLIPRVLIALAILIALIALAMGWLASVERMQPTGVGGQAFDERGPSIPADPAEPSFNNPNKP